MNKIIFTSLVVLLVLNATGCATIVKGKSQNITVDTKPQGAICTLTRDGNTIAVVNPTPETIQINKDKDVIKIVCKKDGYLETSGDVASKFQAMTFGNVIFGGIIGVGVDAGTGAMNEYPPVVTFTLIPAVFGSVDEKDSFFNKLRDDFIIESDDAIKRIKEMCSEDTCEKQLENAEKAKHAKLSEIEERRNQAVIKK